jgi:hypothetical protein
MDLLLEVLQEQEKGTSMDRLPPGYELDYTDPGVVCLYGPGLSFGPNQEIVGICPQNTPVTELADMAWNHHSANTLKGLEELKEKHNKLLAAVKRFRIVNPGIPGSLAERDLFRFIEGD